MAGLSIYRCPSSNGTTHFTLAGRTRGPLSDYVVLVAKYHELQHIGGNPPNTNPHIWNWYNVYRERGNNHGQDRRTFVGPLRLPAITYHSGAGSIADAEDNANWARSITDWSYDDTMARWMRGTSNQLVFSEKHIPAGALRTHVRDEQSRWNGNYMYSGRNNYAANIARPVFNQPHLFAQSPADPETAQPNLNPEFRNVDANRRPSLGSSHPGVVNMVLGDGSVRGVSKTTQPLIVWQLTYVNSSQPVSLP
jgi:hypothetical protein